ncbi:MAG: hypothetical protein JNM56_31390 [Planctomycetia bacterium]|nr:hypothetical protein [Planctomycetia bacterium]
MLTRFRLSPLLFCIIAAGIGWGVFLWTYARVEVEPDAFLVVTHRWGRTLPEGELVAPDESYQGIQRRVLPEGRHFLNPVFYTWERHPVIKVPEKFCAVLIRKSGTEIGAERKALNEFLARGALDLEAAEKPGERGIVEQVLGPGKYRLNPYVYDVETIPAVEIESQQVGVKILLWGREPPKDRASSYFVADGERGVQRSFVPSGTHYINPYVTKIVPVDVRAHTVVFEDIAFPSKDGFTIEPRVQVRYKVVPEKAPELFVMLCEDGTLYQKDDTYEDQLKNPILQKLILPLIRGYVRIEGSKHDAREYISNPKDAPAAVGKPVNPRERLQEELMVKVKPECEKLGIVIDYIAVGQPRMNPTLEELANQIREREQARITRSTNQQKVAQFEREQTLKSTEALAQQRKLVIDANTRLERAKIDARRRLQNEDAEQKAKLDSARARLEGARQRAEAILISGKAEAAVLIAENEAAVAGLRTAIAGFGSSDAFAQYHILLRLSPVLSEIFASDTSEFAKLFSGYLQTRPAALPRDKAEVAPRDKAEVAPNAVPQ